MFFANNDGLLVYNGNKWYSYSFTSNTIIRSVNSINDIVYTGENTDFGFWIKQKNGSYIYTSIPINIFNFLRMKNFGIFLSLKTGLSFNL